MPTLLTRRDLIAGMSLALGATCLTFVPARTTAQTDSLDLARYRGKVVIVDFWASWCGPCRQSFPWLNDMHTKYADRGLVVIGVNVDREHADAQRFLREVPAAFTILYDPEGALATKYDLPGMPTSLTFSTEGQLVGTHIGFRTAALAERENEIRKLLQEVRR